MKPSGTRGRSGGTWGLTFSDTAWSAEAKSTWTVAGKFWVQNPFRGSLNDH